MGNNPQNNKPQNTGQPNTGNGNGNNGGNNPQNTGGDQNQGNLPTVPPETSTPPVAPPETPPAAPPEAPPAPPAPESKPTQSVTEQLQDISEEIADTPRPDKDEPVAAHRDYKNRMNVLSKKAAKLRTQQIDEDASLNDREKEVLKLYDKGMQAFAIAQKVYEFANKDTVGRVMLIIRKAHADDFDELEDVNSTKGYTGVGVGA